MDGWVDEYSGGMRDVDDASERMRTVFRIRKIKHGKIIQKQKKKHHQTSLFSFFKLRTDKQPQANILIHLPKSCML